MPTPDGGREREGGRADLDEDVLGSLIDLDPDGSRGVVDRLQVSFVSEAADRVVEMREAVAANDADTLRRSAHRLKGSSLYFGARLVSDLAKELEERGRDERLDGAGELVERLHEELDLLRVDLPAAMARLRRQRAGS